ncbi:MAG: NHLP leader peptide family RiPP precursor [Bryobacteraceae bacterium]
MGAEWTTKEIEDTIQAAIKRGKTDLAFRKLALSEPNTALQQLSGKELPDGLKVKFFDGSDAHLTIVLPEYVEDESELTDVQLESVAGGGRCAASCVASCAVSSTVSIGLPGVGAVGGCL